MGPSLTLSCSHKIQSLCSGIQALNIQCPEHTETVQGRKEPEDCDPVLPAASRKLLGKRLRSLFDLQYAEKGVRGQL